MLQTQKSLKVELAWMHDELILRLMPFDDVMKKLEKWFDINSYQFKCCKRESYTICREQFFEKVACSR